MLLPARQLRCRCLVVFTRPLTRPCASVSARTSNLHVVGADVRRGNAGIGRRHADGRRGHLDCRVLLHHHRRHRLKQAFRWHWQHTHLARLCAIRRVRRPRVLTPLRTPECVACGFHRTTTAPGFAFASVSSQAILARSRSLAARSLCCIAVRAASAAAAAARAASPAAARVLAPPAAAAVLLPCHPSRLIGLI